MYLAPGKIQHIARVQAYVDRRRESRCTDPHPALHLVWWHGVVAGHLPRLGSLDLQDQYVVRIVVRSKARRLGWREIGVDPRREVQLDLEGMGQRGDRAHVRLNSIEDDRVALNEAVPDATDIEAVVSEPVGVWILILAASYQAHRRLLWLYVLKKSLDRRGAGQEAVEVARAATLDVR